MYNKELAPDSLAKQWVDNKDRDVTGDNKYNVFFYYKKQCRYNQYALLYKYYKQFYQKNEITVLNHV